KSTSLRHAELPTDALLHGRLLVSTQRFNGLPTQVAYAYAKRGQVLEEVQTITGFDHDQPLPDGSRSHVLKIITLQHSVLINQPLLTRDDNDVEIAYLYDALRRVVRETVAPGDPDLEATRKYTYQLVSGPGGQATQTEEDVNGVVTQTLVDGLNRVVARLRQDADNPDLALRGQLRPIYRARYDALGNQVEQTELDWLDYEGQAPRELPLSRQFLFDGWGNPYCEIASDQVRHFDRLDPIGTRLWQGPQQTSWRESADGTLRTGKTVTWLTLFDEPTREERFDADGLSQSVNQLFYDGLQRKAREVNARNEVKQFTYDAFDRLAEETLADDNVVYRDYARHSGEDLPVRIRVGDVVLGEQRFDGLDRMIESNTGGRLRQFSYEPGQIKPSQVRTPAGQLVEYRYLPQLSEEPVMRQITSQQIRTDYDYDGKNARLQRCEEHGQVMSRAYFSHGEVRRETREYQGQTHTMHYQTSLLGRQLGYLDVLGNLQSYEYDAHGRLTRTALSGITSEFGYDALGRMNRIDTREGDRYLITTLHHDDFDREVRRDFDTGDTRQSLSQAYDGEDSIVTKTLSEGSTLLRHETFEYDVRARLVRYECEGSVLPEDPYGKVIQRQVFRFDALDNITRVQTTFAEGVNLANYYFENEDPVQLSRIENSHADYPAQIDLAYDADGNLIRDEAGRMLKYDGLGRLVRVEAPAVIESAFDEDGNSVWDDRGRRLTADASGKLLKVGVPSATTVAVDVPSRANLTPMREADGRLLWCESIAPGEGSTYGYDALDRLTSQES
ncbi:MULTISPECIES: RHS repeat domain-containing protein, partial [unclassified Pseudomonas]|uniref:RHS repeat domain-containing protein n=1 Tax=unclassified Pseudomonas TaxID=196821 RepID=UPI0035C04A78